MPFYEVEVEKTQTVWVDIWVDEGDDPNEMAKQTVGPYMNETGFSNWSYEIINVDLKAEA